MSNVLRDIILASITRVGGGPKPIDMSVTTSSTAIADRLTIRFWPERALEIKKARARQAVEKEAYV